MHAETDHLCYGSRSWSRTRSSGPPLSRTWMGIPQNCAVHCQYISSRPFSPKRHVWHRADPAPYSLERLECWCPLQKESTRSTFRATATTSRTASPTLMLEAEASRWLARPVGTLQAQAATAHLSCAARGLRLTPVRRMSLRQQRQVRRQEEPKETTSQRLPTMAQLVQSTGQTRSCSTASPRRYPTAQARTPLTATRGIRHPPRAGLGLDQAVVRPVVRLLVRARRCAAKAQITRTQVRDVPVRTRTSRLLATTVPITHTLRNRIARLAASWAACTCPSHSGLLLL